MKKQIIVINGTGGCGKTTFVELTQKYGKVINFSSVDKVKEVAKLIGWDGKKTEKDRKFLSDLKAGDRDISLKRIMEVHPLPPKKFLGLQIPAERPWSPPPSI